MNSRYDIGVVGFWYGSNYGSLLNGYASNKIFGELGKSVLMIQKLNSNNEDPELKSGHNVEFVKKYYNSADISPSLPYEKLGELNAVCDTFCAGSDQIWNYTLSFYENLYLPWVKDDKKLISFATSFGHKKDQTPLSAMPNVRKYLRRYSAISVREQFDIDILRDNYGIRGDLVFDPVFCLDKKYYRELAENSHFNETEPYLLTYILDPTPEKREAIMFYREKLGIKAINILDGMERDWQRNSELLNLPNILTNVGAEDFIKAFMNASFVITDSFHGTSFAIIFNKPFISIGNYGRGFERFNDLLGRLKLIDRLVDPKKGIPHDDRYLETIDFTETNELIEAEKIRTVDWLRNAFETPKDKLPSIVLPEAEKAIIHILQKDMCMGCGACVSACPKNALSLMPDDLGYYRSALDYDKCVNCGLCSEVCPALHLPVKGNSVSPKCYEFQAAEDTVLYNSSSGGIFPLLAHRAFQRNGSVVGAAWRDDFSVEHIIIDNEDDLYKLQKSKYLQSYLGDTFRQMKSKLDSGTFALFSGCPCQCAGLKAYLRKEYENLLIVDLLCGNSPSSEFFKKYLADAFPKGVKKYEFRHKLQGWTWDCVTVTVTDGTSVVLRGGAEDDYQRVYHNHTMCASHCERCKYQAVPRFGDLTIGDFWGIEGKDKTIDAKKGVSVVLCNNEKGAAFFDSIPGEKIGLKKEVPLDWLGGNGYAINGSHNYCSPKRNDFYSAIKTMPFSKAVDYALKPKDEKIARMRTIANVTPLQFFSQVFRFCYDPGVWEQHFINGSVVLMTNLDQPKTGIFAVLPLAAQLSKNETYTLHARFQVNTKSAFLNFHIKDSGSNAFQVVHSHHVEKTSKWVDLTVDFKPKSNIFDEFMLGASQLYGAGNFLAIEDISITHSRYC
jgi:coenzyme F420-reducing hydrogenase beta subunit